MLAGCYSVHPRGPRPPRIPVYYRVVTSDFEGRPIAEYIAEGKVVQDDEGFHFWAVQRRIFEPKQMDFRYPQGRKITAAASNTVAKPIEKPLWLKQLDKEE